MTGDTRGAQRDDGARHVWEPTREAAHERLAQFLPSAGLKYAATRNTDFGAADRRNVSLLSPYLRRRLITEQEVLAAVLERHAPERAAKFVQEVYWRSYFKGHLEARPQIFTRYRRGLAESLGAMETDQSLQKRVQRALRGETGIECFDCWVQELVQTGYLHNHTRMWFASIWIFTLELPWELGADFTLRHFLDGDVASNTLSWRWVAGLHTKGKTYLARPGNIEEHTMGRFRPTNLAATAPPLTEPDIGAPVPLPAALPVAPQGRAVLLLHDDDLHPESLPLGECEVAAIAAVSSSGLACLSGSPMSDDGLSSTLLSPLPVSALVERFAAGALDDALARSRVRFGCDAQSVANVDALIALIRSAGASRVVVPYAPVGAAAAAMLKLRPRLAGVGIELCIVRREYDTTVWPHATRGFFALKERIPALIRTLGIAPAQYEL